jgi:hypothetical protein
MKFEDIHTAITTGGCMAYANIVRSDSETRKLFLFT